MAKKKEGDISFANIIALIGLAIIGVLTYMGAMFRSTDGRPAGAIFYALIVVAVLGGLLILMIKAKTAKKNTDKWMLVEWGTLVVYVVAAIFLAGPFQHFFYIMGEKNALKEQANKEIREVRNFVNTYNSEVERAVNKTAEDFSNYKASHQDPAISPKLAKYVNDVASNVDSWREKALKIMSFTGSGQLDRLEDEINAWNIMQLSQAAMQLKENETVTWQAVERKIVNGRNENGLIPEVKGGGANPYYLDGYVDFNLPEKPQARFTQMVQTGKGQTVVGWGVYIILNLLVILNLAVVRRSNYIPPKARKVGGLPL